MSPTLQRSTAELTGPLNHPEVTELPITVLLVDDDEAFVERVGEYLTREHGFTVVTRTHAGDALDYLHSDEPVDCLVSDYQMPDIDGLDLLETVSDQFPQLPFVMFAGQGSEEIASQAIQQGADDYLQKDTGETRYELLAKRIQNSVTIARQQAHLQNLYAAIENAGHAMLVTNQQGTITYVNPTMVELSGYERDELIGKTPAVLKSGEHGHEFYQNLWETILNGEIWEGEVINERKDGSRYVIDQTIAPITDVDDQITGFVAINRDVSDRKERERHLNQFRSAIKHAGHGVVITDTDGTIEYVNKAFERTTGYSATEVIGETPAILNSGEHSQEFYQDLWETILAGDVWHGEVINERTDGTHYIVDQTIAPLTTDDGELDGFVAINRDITQLKEYERDLEKQNDRLKDYGHTVAHDLRNPLGLIEHELNQLRSAVETSKTAIDATTVQEHCSDIEDVLAQMEQLIDDLLTLAEQGQHVLAPEPVSLESVAEDAWEQIVAPTLWEADNNTDAQLTVEDTTLDADPDRLQELLSNLFRNAIEHGGKGVHVSLGPLDFETGFFVEDDGPGIPPDERDQIFDHGYTTSVDGTGFGLAIVNEIATAHDWEVVVTQSTANGARFEFHEPDAVAPSSDD